MAFGASAVWLPTSLIVTPASPECLFGWGSRFAATYATSTAWAANNITLYVPITLVQATTFVKAFWINGTAVSGNVDVGLYSASGTRIAAAGSTAQAGTSAPQEVDITDATVPPGTYLMAISCSTTAATFAGWTAGDATRFPNMGLLQEASGPALPASATLGAVSALFLPAFGLSRRTLI